MRGTDSRCQQDAVWQHARSNCRPGEPWQCLYLSPDPQGQRSLRPTLASA